MLYKKSNSKKTFKTTSQKSELALMAIQIITGLFPMSIAILSIIGSYMALRWFKKSNIELSPIAKQLYTKLLIVLIIDFLICKLMFGIFQTQSFQLF